MDNKYSKMFKVIEGVIGYPNPEKLLKLVMKNPVDSSLVKALAEREHIPTPLLQFKEIIENEYYMTKYRDFYYRFKPKQFQMPCNIWEISDREDRMGFVLNANADIYRLDQIIEMYEEQVKEIYGR